MWHFDRSREMRAGAYFLIIQVCLFMQGAQAEPRSCHFVDGTQAAFSIDINDGAAIDEGANFSAQALAVGLESATLTGSGHSYPEAYQAVEVLIGSALYLLNLAEWDVRAMNSYLLSRNADDFIKDLSMHQLWGETRDSDELIYLGAYGSYRDQSFICPRPRESTVAHNR